MPLQNYTTTVAASKSIQEIQDMLVKNGATDVLTKYEQGTGRIEALSFQIVVGGQPWGFRLPMKWREAQKAMVKQGNRRAANDEDYCYRVAWRITRDWVKIQMTLIELETVALQEVFFPYTITKTGETMYQKVLDNPQFMLGEG